MPTLAQAARLLRKTRQLSQHGIAVSEPILDYPQLLVRTREIVDDVCEHSTSREHLERKAASPAAKCFSRRQSMMVSWRLPTLCKAQRRRSGTT